MTQEERLKAVAALPSFVAMDTHLPEGDAARKVKAGAFAALDAFFRRTKRRAYVSSDLAVFYPDELRIVPDLFVVLDTENRDRTKWVVSVEGKGPDLIVEAYASVEAGREREKRLERYAALGVTEVFLLDRTRRWLRGFRLTRAGGAAAAYEPIEPEDGRLPSRVLELDLMLEGPRLRFLYGTAALPEPEETVAALEAAQCAKDALRLVEEVRARADESAKRAEEAAARTDVLERKLAEALSELHKLKGWE
jgi:hypothetical protein